MSASGAPNGSDPVGIDTKCRRVGPGPTNSSLAVLYRGRERSLSGESIEDVKRDVSAARQLLSHGSVAGGIAFVPSAAVDEDNRRKRASIVLGAIKIESQVSISISGVDEVCWAA